LDRFDRLSCEIAIWGDLALRQGLDAFAILRSNSLRLRPPSELSLRWRVPVWALKRVILKLRAEGVISEYYSHINRYIVLRPRKFLEGLADRLGRRIGPAVALSLPPALRGQPSQQIVESFARAVAHSGDHEAFIILHTALAIGDSSLARAHIFKGNRPVSLAVSREDLKVAERALNLTRLKFPVRKRSKENPLGLPDGFATADLLVFVRRPDVRLRVEVGPWAAPEMPPGLRPINPIVNALLLSLFPLRGEEAGERLLEILASDIHLKCGDLKK